MGNVHRIKKHFWRIVSQRPLRTGVYRLARTPALVYVGVRPEEGTFYLLPYSRKNEYKGLLSSLITEYEATQTRRGSPRR